MAEDLAEYEVGGRKLVFFDTPGHARHHFCIYDQLSDGVFTGDTFGISYDAMKAAAARIDTDYPAGAIRPAGFA